MALKTTLIMLTAVLTMCALFSLYEIRVPVKPNAHQLLSDSTSLLIMNRTIKTNEEKFGMPMDSRFTAPKLVLIQTYMRSGSSLTGDILQHSPGAFYVYEPLRFLGKALSSKKSLLYLNGTIRAPPFVFHKEAADVLYNWFTCNIRRLPVNVLLDSFLNKGIKTSTFLPCLSGKGSKRTLNMKVVLKCALELQAVCEDSPIRILKVIRVQLSDVKHLFEALPNLKMLHLVRDPRAALLSQSHFGMCGKKKGGLPGCVNLLCTKLENDVIETELILKKYPDRIMHVLYENIAKDPIETSKKLYDFIKADFTTEAETYIYNITMAGNVNNCGICTTRSNSTEHVDNWKQRMKPGFLRIVNERCNFILKRYNFDVFPVN